METEAFISLAAASRLYNVSRRTIERLIKTGDLPYHRIGRQIRLSPSDLRHATGRNTSSNVWEVRLNQAVDRPAGEKRPSSGAAS